MIKSIGFFTIVLLVLNSCQESHEIQTISSRPLELRKATTFKNYIGDISSSTFLNDSVIVIANKQGRISFHDLDGNLLNEINAIGTGPREYVMPSIIRSFSDKIYVWDTQLFKMVVFDKDGLAIDEYTNFTRAITDFVFVENFLYLYLTGGDNKYLVQKMNPEDGNILESYIESSPETNLLNMNQLAGGLATFKGKIFAAASSRLNIKLINNNNIEQFSNISDKEFQVDRLTQEATSFFNSDQQGAIEYLMKNSYLKGIYSLENEVVVLCEVGQFVKSGSSFNTKNRYNIFYFLDKNGRLTQKRKGPVDLTMNDQTIIANSQGIYLLKYDQNIEEVEELVLYKVN